MSRPLRFECLNAGYHVMNRGSGYHDIFCNDSHRKLFLDLLSEIGKMFGVEIPEIQKLKSVLSIASIIRAVSVVFTTPEIEILQAKRG